MPSIGQLDRKIMIQEKVITKNDYGEETIQWSDICEVWAAIIYKSGSEKYAAEQLTAINTVTFIIRYLNWITEENRIIYRDSHYDIIYLAEKGRRKYLEITSEKGFVSEAK